MKARRHCALGMAPIGGGPVFAKRRGVVAAFIGRFALSVVGLHGGAEQQ